MPELFDKRRLRAGRKSFNVAVRREAYSDRLYAWMGRADNPDAEWTQESIETRAEFLSRVKRAIQKGVTWGYL